MDAIIFDFDDTLVVSRKDRFERLLEALALFGYPVERKTLEIHWGKPFKEMVIKTAPKLVGRFDHFIDMYCNHLRMFPPSGCPGLQEAIPILASFAKLYIHSSSDSRLIETDLNMLGLATHFAMICGSDKQKMNKPHPSSLDLVIEDLFSRGISLSKAIYVGDTSHDEKVAASRGLQFVRVEYDNTSVQSIVTLKKYTAQLVINTLVALIPFVTDNPSI